MTYPEAVDQALCYGWIDGVRKGVDEVSYAQRFTPRTARSHWSAINQRRAAELHERGLMTPAGLKALAVHDGKPAPYSYEQRPTTFSPAFTRRFKAEANAWKYFASRPPGYRRLATFWVMSAKKEETRERRLATLIADSAAGRPNQAAGAFTAQDARPVIALTDVRVGAGSTKQNQHSSTTSHHC